MTVGALADTDTRILKTAALKGLLQRATDEGVNFVNADYFAEHRGIHVSETKRSEIHDFVAMVALRADDSTRPRRDRLDAHRQEGRAEDRVAVRLRHRHGAHQEHGVLPVPDRPGMIGKVGTILGAEGINIATMQVGRAEAGGQALMCLSVDTALSPDVLEAIKVEADMANAWNVTL